MLLIGMLLTPVCAPVGKNQVDKTWEIGIRKYDEDDYEDSCQAETKEEALGKFKNNNKYLTFFDDEFLLEHIFEVQE